VLQLDVVLVKEVFGDGALDRLAGLQLKWESEKERQFQER